MKNIFNIIKLARPQRTWIIVVAVLIAVQAALQQASPITLKFVVDELTAQISTGNGDFDRLLMLFGLILSINLVGVILHAVNMRIGDHIASRLGRYLTELYYKKIFTLPQLYFDSELSGKMINQLNRGTQSITDFVGSMTNFIVPAILQSIFSIVVLSYYDPLIGLLSFLVFPMYVAISSYSTKKWGEIQVVKNGHIDATRGRIQEVISNIKLVKTYNTQGREWKHVSGEYQTINTLYDKQSTQYHILNFLREFGLEIAVVLILFLVFRNTFVGTLSLGEMVLIIQLLNQLRRPLYGMSYILEQVNRAEADSKAFFEVLSLKEHERYHAKALPPIIPHPAVELDHVSFSYPEGDEVLTDISVKFGKKQTVALVGHSGAGKTTLINLILKLYEPSAGSILLDSKPYKDADHSWIRAHMALVFQDNELFSSTIRENVSYGMSDASDEAIWSALKKANAARFVRSFKDGIDTHIGERGVKLSGGQKQRIQIARAILHDKPILILDEATSSLDSKSEAAVQKALETLFKNRLVIIIAHRFSTIQNANYVVVLDQGTVADAGTPQELAKRPGIYSELLQYQIEGNNKLLSKYELY